MDIYLYYLYVYFGDSIKVQKRQYWFVLSIHL